MNIAITDISLLRGTISGIEDELFEISQARAKLLATHDRMRDVWKSDTLDKSSYMISSEKNLEVLSQYLNALEKTMSVLKSYLMNMEREKNN